MSKSVAAMLVMVFLIASCLLLGKPALSFASVAEDSWASKAPMQLARSSLGVAVVNGKIYAIGGSTENGYIPNSGGNDYNALGWIVATNEEYDLATDTWAFKKPMPTPRYNFAIAAYQNKIYCIGGITNWVSGQVTYTGVNEVYDSATDTWETKAPMPTATSAQANVVGGRIFLIGGGPTGTLNQAYDPETDSWTLKEPMPSALGSHPPPNTLSTLVSAVVDDKIYVMSFTVFETKTEIYNPRTDNWSLGTSSPSGFLEGGGSWWSQTAGATTGVMAAKRIYVFFATYPYSTLLPNVAYNPSGEVWTAAAAVPKYRQNLAVAVVNDTLYAIGGRGYNYPFPDDNYFTVTEEAVNEQYTPIGYGTPDPSYDGTTPKITVTSPENKTYYTTDIPLNFSVNEPVSQMRYKLDAQAAFEIPGNTTLIELSYGLHNLTVYATDVAGNTGTSEPITFTVAEPEPFPTVLAATASAATAAIISVGLLVYFKKRNQQS